MKIFNNLVDAFNFEIGKIAESKLVKARAAAVTQPLKPCYGKYNGVEGTTISWLEFIKSKTAQRDD